jgi:hypothetical protein
MRGRIIAFIALASWLAGAGCAYGPLDRHVEEIQYENGKLRKFSYLDDSYGQKGDSSNFVAAIDTLKHVDPMALPELEDLPVPGLTKPRPRPYTGVIQNKTRYEVSIPSENSDGTLVIPPYGWIEFIAWSQFFKLTAYHDGKPFYCLKIHVHPKTYPFMCRKYDFMAEIVKPEPVQRYKPVRKRRIKKKRPKVDKEVQGVV